MVANMGPMMASGDATRDHQGKWRYVEAATKGLDTFRILDGPRGPKKTDEKGLELKDRT